jgi:hypothetical protein
VGDRAEHPTQISKTSRARPGAGGAPRRGPPHLRAPLADGVETTLAGEISRKATDIIGGTCLEAQFGHFSVTLPPIAKRAPQCSLQRTSGCGRS